MVLRSFRIENHRSFRDEAELSLLPGYGKGRTLVPVVAVYGANAAGKSNLLDGLRFMSDAVRHSYRRWEPTTGVPRSPFRLAADSGSRPSTYVIELLLNDVRHVYGFILDDEKVHEEWLYSYPRARRRTLFERHGLDFDLGESLRGARAKADVLAELTRPNALFLSLAAQVGLAEVTAVYDWFAGGGLQVSDPAERSRSTASHPALIKLAQGTEADRDRFLSLLQAADVGISDVVVEHQAGTDPFPIGIDVKWVNWVKPFASDGEVSDSPAERAFLEWTNDLIEGKRNRIRFRHGDSELFDFADESAGTRSWLSLLPRVLTVLDSGGMLLIDEIDSSLHPHLTALLIRQFRSVDSNPLGAQLIFTTHDATLLGTSFGEEVLDRDQIWFVEKDLRGASRLYPLTDFHPRTGENRERRYLSGSYGGVPVIGLPDLRPPPGPDHPDDEADRSRAAETAEA